jgi:Ca-activated chloride channel family protein
MAGRDDHHDTPSRPRDVPDSGGALVPAPGTGLTHRRRKLLGTVYLLLDHSASMGHDQKLLQVQRGAIRFFAEAWRRDYAVGTIGFAARARVLLGASRNFHRFQRSLRLLEADGHTAMASAIRKATMRLRWRRGERVMVLITDGMPNSREATLQAAAVARALGITLVAVGTGHADEDFLAALTPRPELASSVGGDELEEAVGAAALTLPADGER